MAWTQAYDPLNNRILSTLVAALPILGLFGLLAGLRVKPHWCAIAAAATAVLVAVLVYGMPVSLAGMSFLYGVGFGVLKRDLRGAARHPDGGNFIQCDAVLLVQPRGLEPRRHRGRGHLPRRHGDLPAVLAAEADLAAGARARDARRGARSAPAHRGSDRQGLDAVRHPLGLRARVGSAGGQGGDEPRHHSDLGRALPAPRGVT